MIANRITDSRISVSKVDMSIKELLGCEIFTNDMQFHSNELESNICRIVSFLSPVSIDYCDYIRFIIEGFEGIYPFIGYKNENDGYRICDLNGHLNILKLFIKNKFHIRLDNKILYFKDLTDSEKNSFLQILLPVYRINH